MSDLWSQQKIVRLWRKYGIGRLYWKNANWRWRNRWDFDDVAMWRDGAASMHFKTYRALQEFLMDLMIEQNAGEK